MFCRSIKPCKFSAVRPAIAAAPPVNEKLNGSIPVLKYFPARGRAEPIRLLFEDQGIRYEDVRINPSSWPAEKQHLLETGASLFGQLPVVILDGVTLSQSLAILRFFSRIYGEGAWLSLSPFFFFLFLVFRFTDHLLPSLLAPAVGLYGSNALEAFVIDEAIDMFGDILKDAAELFCKDPAQKAVYLAKRGPEHLVLLSKIVGARGGPFLLPDKMSFADLVLYQLLDLFKPDFPNLAQTHPPLGNLISAVEKRPGIAAYLVSGRVPKSF